MSLTLPKTWSAGEVLTAADLNAQFDAIETKFSGAILGSEVTAGTIPNSALINDDYEFLVNLKVQVAAAAGKITSSATMPRAVVGLPGSTTDGTAYTVLSATAFCSDTGNAGDVLTFAVKWGDFTAALGAFTEVGAASVITATNITAAAGAANQFQAVKPNITTSALTLTDANARFLALFITANAGAALTVAFSEFSVTLKLKRTSGLRA